MNAVDGWLVDAEQFYAPAPFDLFDTLMGQYRATRTRLEAMAAAVSAEECAGVLHYFVKGNCNEQKYTLPGTVAELFDLSPAVAQLDADFWDRALKLTDVLDIMPQARRNEWFEQIRNPMGVKRRYGHSSSGSEWEIEPIPAFTEETVRGTLESLIAMRGQFFGERVDGIFRSLSRTHVTNCPQGFRKRMILQRAVSEFGTVESGTAGVINDLRCVIARFMGREEPKYGATDDVIKAARRRAGEWMPVDGNAFRIRVYAGVGTAHLEVHPDMAWRLNAVLASLHPTAIPAEFRERPKRERKLKDFELMQKPLPFAVLSLLAGMKPGKRNRGQAPDGRWDLVSVPGTLAFGYDYGNDDKAARKQAEAVLSAIGGVFVPGVKGEVLEHWAFGYDVSEVMDEIVCSGVIPDHQSHQFYPTPASVADVAIGAAAEGARNGMRWLEPSAGTGGLADPLVGLIDCVEISELHAKILAAKGHKVVCADFLSLPADPTYDRVLMNPPFSSGRWQAHLEHAAKMVAAQGRIVAILPSSARGKDLLPGFIANWSDVLENQFAGTSVSVVIGVFDRA